MENHILIRYGELALKKSNRRQFTNKIISCIKRALNEFPDLTYVDKGMRFYILLNNTPAEPILEILKKIPGIYSFSVVSKCESTLDDILKTTLEIVKEKVKPTDTIKVDTSRSNKQINMTSIEISQAVARNLFRNIENLKADMHHPTLTINLDVRDEGTFIFTHTIYGLGGLPSGILGGSMLMISGGIDSVVAGFMAIKKGIYLNAIHFYSPPYTSPQALQKVVDLLEVLTPYTEHQNINLFVVPFTKIQTAIYDNVREDYGITIMRRMMYRITERLMKKHKGLAIINGENIGQVASQTLESMTTIGEVVSCPIIRPLATFDKSEIIEVSKQINAYDISIRPYEDCCTVFVPKHPQIKPNLKTAINEENKFDYEALIEEAMENIDRVVVSAKRHQDIISKDDIF